MYQLDWVDEWRLDINLDGCKDLADMRRKNTDAVISYLAMKSPDSFWWPCPAWHKEKLWYTPIGVMIKCPKCVKLVSNRV